MLQLSSKFRMHFLTHVHTLEKLYSSLGLENDFCTFLSQVTSSFSPQEKNVIIQMDEVHVKSDISYKGGRIFGPNLSPDNPTKTVLLSWFQVYTRNGPVLLV